MKSKYLLMALALPAAFAACTDDALVSENPNVDLASRRMVGNIAFTNSEIESRVGHDANDNFTWTDDDVLGAALMDEFNGSTYTVVDQLYSNYGYTYDKASGSFTSSDAYLVEGNYFVYGQWKKDQTRAGLKYEIEAVQTVAENSARSSWYKNQMFLDHIFVTEGVAPSLNMKGVFSLPAFSAKYEGTAYTDLVIDKIVVTDIQSGSGFETSGFIKPSVNVVYNAFLSTDVNVIPGKGYNYSDYTVASGNLAAVMEAHDRALKDQDVKYTLKENKTIASPIIADFFVGSKVPSMTLSFEKPASAVQGYMVAPFNEPHAINKLKVEIYTNRGLVTLADGASTLSQDLDFDGTYSVTTGEGAGAVTTVYNGKDYKEITAGMTTLQKAAADIKFDDGINEAFVKGLAPNKIQLVSISFKDNAVLVPSELTVNSTDELEKYLKNWYAGKKNKVVGGTPAEANNVVNVIAAPTEGNVVAISKDVLSFITDTENNPVVRFSGDVVIPSDAVNTVLNTIKQSEGKKLNVTNYGTQEWTKTNTFESLVNKGTLTLAGGGIFTVTTNEIFNEGTMTINRGPANDETIYNTGTLTVNDAVYNLVNGHYENNEVVYGSATATLNANVNSLHNHAVTNIPAGKNITIAAAMDNEGTVNVNGNLTLNGTSVNKYKITVASNMKLNVTDSFINATTGEITNNGYVEAKGGAINNEGSIKNNGEISCNVLGGEFHNNGYIESALNTKTLITSNNEGAEILVAGKTALVTIPNPKTQEGKVTYVAAKQADLANIPSYINSLRITADEIDFSDCDLNKDGVQALGDLMLEKNYLEFQSSSSMSVTFHNSGTSFENIKFNAVGGASKVNFYTFGKFIANETLEVSENAEVVINDQFDFNSFAYNFNNNGRIYVVGLMKFNKIEEQTGTALQFMGDVQCPGGIDKNIDWSGTASGEAIVATAADLNTAISDANVSTITLVGEIKGTNTTTTISKDLTIKGGTLEGFNFKVEPNKNANVTFDGVTFNDNEAFKQSTINVRQGNGNVVVRNCTFNNYAYDAIQVYNNTNVANKIIIENNVFKGTTANADGSMIHIAGETVQNSAKIVIRNNTFESFDGFTDNPIKIYGMISFDQVTVSGNDIRPDFVKAAQYYKNQIIISTALYGTDGVLENLAMGNVYNPQMAYEAFESVVDVTLEATGKTVADTNF